MEETDIIEIEAIELSRKRKSKTFHRVRPIECPIKQKYCYKSSRQPSVESPTGFKTTEEYRCPYLEKKRTGNEEGYLVVSCSCPGNSFKFIMENDNE